MPKVTVDPRSGDQMTLAFASPPEQGQLVSVRSRNWIVNEVAPSTLPERGLHGLGDGQTLVSLASVEDDGLGGKIRVIWEVVPGAQDIPEEIGREAAAIRARLADPQARMFPVADTFLVPERMAKS
jgi:hypothetical protein